MRSPTRRSSSGPLRCAREPSSSGSRARAFVLPPYFLGLRSVRPDAIRFGIWGAHLEGCWASWRGGAHRCSVAAIRRGRTGHLLLHPARRPRPAAGRHADLADVQPVMLDPRPARRARRASTTSSRARRRPAAWLTPTPASTPPTSSPSSARCPIRTRHTRSPSAPQRTRSPSAQEPGRSAPARRPRQRAPLSARVCGRDGQ